MPSNLIAILTGPRSRTHIKLYSKILKYSPTTKRGIFTSGEHFRIFTIFDQASVDMMRGNRFKYVVLDGEISPSFLDQIMPYSDDPVLRTM